MLQKKTGCNFRDAESIKDFEHLNFSSVIKFGGGGGGVSHHEKAKHLQHTSKSKNAVSKYVQVDLCKIIKFSLENNNKSGIS